MKIQYIVFDLNDGKAVLDQLHQLNIFYRQLNTILNHYNLSQFNFLPIKYLF